MYVHQIERTRVHIIKDKRYDHETVLYSHLVFQISDRMYGTITYGTVQNRTLQSKGRNGPNRTRTTDRIFLLFHSNSFGYFLLGQCFSILNWSYVSKICGDRSQNDPLIKQNASFQPFAPYCTLYRSLPWLLSKSCINTVLLHKTVPYSKPCWHNTGMNE